MKKILALLGFLFAFPAFGQGVVAPGHVIGNGSGSNRTATDYSLSLILDQLAGATNGLVLVRQSGAWTGSATPLGYVPAHSGINSDITSLTGLTTQLTVSEGGTGTNSTTANYFFAGPNGSGGAPSFRAIVANDIPAVNASAISTVNSSAVLGTTAGGSASAGYVGELISSSIAVGSAVTMTTSGTSYNITSVSLTAGDWDCEGSVISNPAGTTTTQRLAGGMSTTSATLPTAPAGGYALASAAVAGISESVSLPRAQFNSSSSQTVYLVGVATFSVSTMTGYGQISCRRVR